MYNILKYHSYISKNNVNILKESIYIDYKNLIKTVNGKKLDLYNTFNIDNLYDNISELYNDTSFNKDINNKDIFKTKIEYSNDYDTYLNKNQSIKFFCLSKENSNKLDIKYIVIQVKNIDGKWNDIELYEINSDIRRFYDGLSTRTIEIYDNKENNYIYITSNSGENWILKNVENENNIFKKNLSIEELKYIIKKYNYKIVFI